MQDHIIIIPQTSTNFYLGSTSKQLGITRKCYSYYVHTLYWYNRTKPE